MLESTSNNVVLSALKAELDQWLAVGRKATFWWRDDDAREATTELYRLLDLSDNTPIAIAVIPNGASETLSAVLSQSTTLSILQHGYAHANHSPRYAKKSEFGPHRPLLEMLSEIERGNDLLHSIAPNHLKPIFVPPWNRIDDSLAHAITGSRFEAVSVFGRSHPSKTYPQLNVNIDIIDWRHSRGFIGTEAAISKLICNLSYQRTQNTKDTEAIGLMTHHLAHDEDCWNFIQELLNLTLEHPSVRWVSVEELLETKG